MTARSIVIEGIFVGHGKWKETNSLDKELTLKECFGGMGFQDPSLFNKAMLCWTS
jgi:hypothetical protein